MSILVKGMEMPKSCWDCPMCHSNAEYDYEYCCVSSAETSGNKIPYDCPLIEVPKHGKLIDADALEVHDGWLRDSKYFSQDSSHTHITFVYSNDICNAPIIIEAEDGE